MTQPHEHATTAHPCPEVQGPALPHPVPPPV